MPRKRQGRKGSTDMTMRYGTDEAEEGRRRRRAGQTPARQVEGSYRVDPRGNVTPPKELAPKQPRVTARQTVNEETPRRGLAPEFLRFMAQNPMPQVGQIGGRVPPTRPQATPLPYPQFSQQLVQSGMMTGNQPMRNREGQVLPALTPGYSVNPMHPAWARPVPIAGQMTPDGSTLFGGQYPNIANYGTLQHYQGGQFRPGMNPMDYYGSDFFRNTPHYQAPNRNFGNSFQGVPRVWNENEITPEGFRGIVEQYGANIPWMRRNQMNPFGF